MPDRQRMATLQTAPRGSRFPLLLGLGLGALAVVAYLLLARPAVAPTLAPLGPAVGPADPPVVLEGRGVALSRSVRLDGDYQLSWGTRVITSSPTLFAVYVRSVDGASHLLQVVDVMLDPADGPQAQGEAYAYRVEPGTYALDVIADTDWQIRVSPVR